MHVSAHHTSVESLILAMPQLAPHYVLQPMAEGRQAMLRVELAPAWCTACSEERAGYAQALRSALRAQLSMDVQVQVIEPGALMQSSPP